MKKIIQLSVFLLASCAGMTTLSAQSEKKENKQEQRDERKKKIEEVRKQYLIEKLSLTEKEQSDFLPLFSEYKNKDHELTVAFHKKYKDNDLVFMDDKQAEQYLTDAIKLKEDQMQLYKNYIEQFKKVLPIKKVAMLGQIDREFKREMFKKAYKGGKK